MDITGEELRHIVETLAYGSADEVAELIYGSDLLTESQLDGPLKLLGTLHDPTSASASSGIVDAVTLPSVIPGSPSEPTVRISM
jgi:hypothetical protein